MDVIEMRGLYKAYGGHRAVAGVDLRVAVGEVVAVLGPNGAGKTTMVEILEGHRSRDAGEVRVLGCDPGTAGRAWRARIGVVLQDAADVGELTVGEALRHFARLYPRPVGCEELMDICGLSGKRDARIATLSGGQRRRVDVALGIVGRPELLFLDEPTTGFDPVARRQFWAMIQTLSQAGTSILLTTHYLDEAEALADRITVLSEGVVVAEGTPAALTRKRDGTQRTLESVYLDLIGAMS